MNMTENYPLSLNAEGLQPPAGGSVQVQLVEHAQSITGYDPAHRQQAQAYILAGLAGADNSSRAYLSDLRQYAAWCDQHGHALTPLPVASLMLYIAELAPGKKYATIQRHVASISRMHRLANAESPTASSQFTTYLKGIRRTIRTDQQLRPKQAPAFTVEAFTQAVDSLAATPTGRRDKAILLLGFTGAFRRGELSALDIDQLSIDTEGMVIRLAHSKTNQYGEVEEKAVTRLNSPYCPVAAVEAWQDDIDQQTGQQTGPLFRRIRRGGPSSRGQITGERLRDEWVNRLVQATLGPSFTAHSLRASFVTIAKANQVDNRVIMNQTKHVTTVMIDRYDRRRDVRQNNASDKLGL